MKLTRREFLGFGGLVATTAGALEDFLKHKLLGLPPEEGELLLPQEPARWVPSVCRLCPAGCGVAARVTEGRVVKLEGLPAHPVSRGALCPRGLAGLTELYHPDRLLRPMKRVGKRGDGQFEPVEWEEAFQLIVERLRALQQAARPNRMAWLEGPTDRMSRQLIRRFLRVFGTSNEFELGWPTGELPVDAFRAMVDREGEPLVDLAQASFILSFGLDWLQAYPSPVEASRAYGLLRRGRLDRRVRMIQMEPRFSVTAAKSDEWVPVRPGQEARLALSMVHVLIRERFFDEPFVRENTAGFEELARFVEAHVAPEAVAGETGLPAEAIAAIAREFGLKKGLALGTRADLVTQWAVMCLNGLVGNLDVRGGILRRWEPPGLSLAADPRMDQAAGQDSQAPRPVSAETLASRILSNPAPPVDILFISRANPCFLSPAPSRWVGALSRLSFVVSFASHLDETALQADLILPLPVAYEQWQFIPAFASDGGVVANITPPVLRPRGEARPMEEVLMEIAHRMGPPFDEAFPWDTLEQLVRERTQALYEAKQGTLLPQIVLPGLPMPEEEAPPTSFEEFWELLLTRGGLTWPAEAAPWPEFRTPSGAFEFWPREIAAVLNESTWPPVRLKEAPQAGYPLRIFLYTPLAFLGGDGAHLPNLQQIAGAPLHEAWETWAEIHPRTAQEAGIRDGEPIWVESAHGRVQAKARWYEGVVPGVVAMPLGLGHTEHGCWAKGIGANPTQLVRPTLDPHTGQPLWQETWVRVWKA